MKTLCTFCVLIILFSCSSPDQNSSSNTPEADRSRISKVAEEKKLEENRNRVVRILKYMPSPIETSVMVEAAGMKFNEEVLNDRNNFSGYISFSSKALNLGIYGADLGYVRVHNKVEYIESYLVPIKSLAQELGIPSTFTERTYINIDTHYQDKEKALNLLTEAFTSIEKYLRTNDRNESAALMVIGGWIEGMYISCESMEEGKHTPQLVRQIAEQKYTLDQIIAMLSGVEANRVVTGLLSNLQLLRKKYDVVDFDYVDTELQVDSVKFNNYWKNHPNWTLSEGDFEEIRLTVAKLREYATQ